MALFTIAKRWKQPRSPSAGEWVHYLQCTPPISYCLAVKRSELLICTTTHMNPKSILLSERKLYTKGTCHVSLSVSNSTRKVNLRMVGTELDRHRGTGLVVTFNTLIWVWVTQTPLSKPRG